MSWSHIFLTVTKSWQYSSLDVDRTGRETGAVPPYWMGTKVEMHMFLMFRSPEAVKTDSSAELHHHFHFLSGYLRTETEKRSKRC